MEDGKTLTFDENEVSAEEFAATNQEIFTMLSHTARQIPLEEPGIPYQQVMTRFADCILKGSPLIADGWDGLKEVQLANAVYVSGWEERRVAVPVREADYRDGLHSRQQAEKRKAP